MKAKQLFQDGGLQGSVQQREVLGQWWKVLRCRGNNKDVL